MFDRYVGCHKVQLVNLSTLRSLLTSTFSMNHYKVFLVITLLVASLFPYEVNARCACNCVDGRVMALCSNTLEIPPICAPRICPLRSPSIKPLPSLQLKPLGTTYCRQAQVYNAWTNRYEWQRVCN